MSEDKARQERERDRDAFRWRCRHFDCNRGKYSCAAGVSIGEAFDDRRPGIALRLPCHGPEGLCDRAEPMSCDKYSPLSAEEFDEFEAKQRAALMKSMENLVKIDDARTSGKKSGEFDCAACGTKVRWRVEGPREHFRAACGTPGCFSAIE